MGRDELPLVRSRSSAALPATLGHHSGIRPLVITPSSPLSSTQVITGKKQNTAGIRRDAGSSGHRRILVYCLLLCALVFCTFLPSLRNGFVSYDDPRYIMANSHVASGLKWENVEWALTATAMSNWHPLTWLSHMLDCSLFGLNPWGHHLTSLLLHTVNTLLLFLFLWRTTGATGCSLFVAALFGLHPLRVESVAWAAERKDVLSAFFFLLTLLAYARYAKGCDRCQGSGVRDEVSSFKCQVSSGEISASNIQHPTSNIQLTTHNSRFWSLPDYWFAVLLFALGLMCKPMLVTLPFVLLLLDHWPLKRVSGVRDQVSSFKFQVSSREISATNIQHPTHNSSLSTHNSRFSTLLPLLIEKIPFLLLSAGSCVVTFHAQRGAMVWMAHVPFLDRMGNALVSCWRYLGKLLWPANLSCLYPLSDWSAPTVLLAGASLLAVSALAIVLWRRSPFFFSGWFWFLGTLVPVIGLVAVGEQSIADRYTYIPCIGVFFAFAWGVRDLTRGRRWQTAALRVAATGIVLACIPVTRQNLGYWKDTETLFRHALQTTGKNYRASVNLGGELFHQGRINDAMECFLKAVEFKPDSAEAHSDLGVALHARHRSAEAILEQKEALRLKPDFAEAHFNLGNLLEEAGQLEESIQEYQRAAALRPEPLFHRHLGTALARCGRVEEAMTAFQQALALDPRDATARVGLGEAFQRKGRVEEAVAQFKEALRIDPQNMSARTNLDLMPNKARQDEQD